MTCKTTIREPKLPTRFSHSRVLVIWPYNLLIFYLKKNTSTARISDTLSSRHRYQRKPSNVFIGRVRIELHSEHPQHFSGRRFVECVSDRIRTEGNLGLGICAVPNGCDADSGNALGKYSLRLLALTLVFMGCACVEFSKLSLHVLRLFLRHFWIFFKLYV